MFFSNSSIMDCKVTLSMAWRMESSTFITMARKGSYMKAVQINRYSKTIHTQLCDVPQPSISESEVLIQVKAAAVNPLELLILTGSV